MRHPDDRCGRCGADEGTAHDPECPELQVTLGRLNRAIENVKAQRENGVLIVSGGPASVEAFSREFPGVDVRASVRIEECTTCADAGRINDETGSFDCPNCNKTTREGKPV